MFHNKVVGLWLELKQRFTQGHQSCIVDLLEELYSLKQGNSFITSFYTQLKSIWSELENYKPIGPCACG